MSILFFAYGLIELVERVFVPVSLCGGKYTATNNTDENSLGRLCGLPLIIRYSTSGKQPLETSLILEIAHPLVLTKRHIPPTPHLTRGSAFCWCMENPSSSILSVSSFSHVSVKHKMLQFLMSIGRIILFVGHVLYFPMIAH